MRAAYYEQTGHAATVLHIGDIPSEIPSQGEVCVRVRTSGVNPSDVKKRMGQMAAPAYFPKTIPHSDGAGVITAVGPGVPENRIGQRVWLWNAQWKRAFGTAAELCVLPAPQAVPLPDAVSFAEGACLGIPAQTAWTAVMDGTPGPGKTVLIHGGAGAVGEMAVAIAADAGATVIATISSEEKASIARTAGAHVVVNRHSEDIAQSIMKATNGSGVDHIVDVDFGANWQINAASIAENGSIAAYSAPSAPRFEIAYYAFAARAVRLRFVQVYLLPSIERAATIDGLTDLIGRRRLPIRIGAAFTLDQIAHAHTLQEDGAVIGNIVIDFSDLAD